MTRPAKNFHMTLLLIMGSFVFSGPLLAADAVNDWQVDFFDDFETFDHQNWQDQLLWVNGEDQCYVRDGQYGTREIRDGILVLRVIDLGTPRPCFNWDKRGNQHYPTPYVAGRIASKNRQEFVGGRWTARLRIKDSGQPGMFPAWWLLGAQNNEPPVEEPNENVCWPMTGSGEIDIFEHHSDGGPDHYAARIITNLGECGGGDWQANMLVQATKLGEWHEYAVEWSDTDIIFRLDDREIYRIKGASQQLPEPFFAILNFAKIKPGPMQQPWSMEIDWVKHEYRD
ncbi:MAG: glycoside hydrolase family 16 protein [Pseudomonadales bacterium]